MFSDFDSYSQYYGISNRQNTFEDNNFENGQGYNIQQNISNGFDTRHVMRMNISTNSEIISINKSINKVLKLNINIINKSWTISIIPIIIRILYIISFLILKCFSRISIFNNYLF